MKRQTQTKAQKPPLRVSHTRSGVPSPPVHPLLNLQRLVGNQAANRLTSSPYIQAKLQVSTPGDSSEQEADRVADTVMRMSEPGVSRQAQPPSRITPLVQRETDQFDEDDQIVSPKSKSHIPVAVREDDEEEETSVQRACDECEDEMVHRADGEEDEETIQRDHTTGTQGQIRNSTAQSIRGLNGHGSPLPAASRSF